MDKRLNVYLSVLKEIKDNIKVSPSNLFEVFLLNKRTKERIHIGEYSADDVPTMIKNIEPFCYNLFFPEDYVVLIMRDFSVSVEFDSHFYHVFTKRCLIDVLSCRSPDFKNLRFDNSFCPF